MEGKEGGRWNEDEKEEEVMNEGEVEEFNEEQA